MIDGEEGVLKVNARCLLEAGDFEQDTELGIL